MVAEAVLLPVDWRAPPGVRVAVTVRAGGVSGGPYTSFNLGDHVGDDPAAVARNRALLVDALALPCAPQWLQQVHGTGVVEAHADGVVREADAAWTDRSGMACAVLTADCLPVVIASADGRQVAAAHCGWRGLAAGVLAQTVARFSADASSLRAWLGPAIGPSAFEVGEDVREAFLAVQPASQRESIDAAFMPLAGMQGKFLADLYALARIFLSALGVEDVAGGGRCTFRESDLFFSYRRDGVTGRMATLAWIDPAQGIPSPT
jgi:YfiH family protein